MTIETKTEVLITKSADEVREFIKLRLNDGWRLVKVLGNQYTFDRPLSSEPSKKPTFVRQA